MNNVLDAILDYMRANDKRLGVCHECDTYKLVDAKDPGTCECGRPWILGKEIPNHEVEDLKEYVEDEGRGMSDEELEDMANFAARIFDDLVEDKEPKLLTRRDFFILGFIHGRSFTLEQLGVFDEDIDNDITGEPPEIIKKYLEYDRQKD